MNYFCFLFLIQYINIFNNIYINKCRDFQKAAPQCLEQVLKMGLIAHEVQEE